jgi:hypothetical protein
MYVKAKQLCTRGQRRSHQEIAADDGKVGELTLAMVGHTYQLNLNDHNSSTDAPLFPVLHDAALITMGGERMMFKGIEKPQGEAGPGYVQEWSVQVIPRG